VVGPSLKGPLAKTILTAAAVMALGAASAVVLLVHRAASQPPAAPAVRPDRSAPQAAAEPSEPPARAVAGRLRVSDALRRRLRAEADALQRVSPAGSGPITPAARTALRPEQLYAGASPAVVRVLAKDRDGKTISRGTGFLVSADGLLITNYHVLQGADHAGVQLPEGTALDVEGVAAANIDADLALLKAKGRALAHLPLADGALPKVGSTVYAIGNPQGLTNTFSKGMVSGVRKMSNRQTVIQTTAAISAGSSGGPLLAADGRVVGVTSAFSRDGQNLNFAIPARQVRRLLLTRGEPKKLPAAASRRPNAWNGEQLDQVWVAIAENDLQTAAKTLAELRRSQQDNPYVWFASAYLEGRAGRHQGAVAHYRKALRLKPDFADAAFGEGIELAQLERHAQAAEAFGRVVARWPDSAEAHCQMGLAYGCLGRHADSIAACRKAVKLRPDYAEAWFCIGYSRLALEQHAEAVDALTRAVQLRPRLAEAHHLLGKALAAAGQDADAVGSLRQAILLRPDLAEAHLDLGCALLRAGRRREALEAYQSAARLDPNGETAQLAAEGIRLAQSQPAQD
jgi:S1-C subfamily serine protease/tetratricopeptide (TPR) repeat protein